MGFLLGSAFCAARFGAFTGTCLLGGVTIRSLVAVAGAFWAAVGVAGQGSAGPGLLVNRWPQARQAVYFIDGFFLS